MTYKFHFSFLILIVLTSFVYCQDEQPEQLKHVKALLKEKCALEIKLSELKLQSIESDQVGDDYTEVYVVKLSESKHLEIVDEVSKNSSWRSIEKGYERIVMRNKNDRFNYIFFISNHEQVLVVQKIIE